MEKEQQKGIELGVNVRIGTIEGVVVVNGQQQIERADMPLALSFGSIEELEQFCKMAREIGRDQH